MITILSNIALLSETTPEGGHLTGGAVVMLLFACLVLYGGFMWCVSIASRVRSQGNDPEGT